MRTRRPDDPRETLGSSERIAYRLTRARTTLAEARHLAEEDLWHGSINRCYYACFYAVHALLASHELEAHTHEGTQTLFGKHFVKPGLVSSDFGTFFNALLDLRMESDFDDFVDLDPEEVTPRLDQADTFIDTVASHLDVDLAPPEEN